MSEMDIDDLLTTAFAEFRSDTASAIRPAGTGAAAGTVRRRRRNRMAGTAAAVVLAVAAPVAGFALLRPSGTGPDVAATTLAPAPTSAGPSPTPSRTVPSRPPSQPAAGYDLNNATFSVPTWPDGSDNSDGMTCPAGPLTFHDGNAVASSASYRTTVARWADVDLDEDGIDEIVAVVYCYSSEVHATQAVVLQPAAGHALTTLGVLAHSSARDIKDILSVTPVGHGQVDLVVNDLIPCCATPDVLALRQTRRYRFADGHGIQTAGNTSFYVARDGAGVSITGSRTISGPSQQLSITVHNGGSRAVPVSVLAFLPTDSVAASGGSWSTCTYGLGKPDGGPTALCDFGTLTAGASATYTLPITTGKYPGICVLFLRIGDQKYENSDFVVK